MGYVYFCELLIVCPPIMDYYIRMKCKQEVYECFKSKVLIPHILNLNFSPMTLDLKKVFKLQAIFGTHTI